MKYGIAGMSIAALHLANAAFEIYSLEEVETLLAAACAPLGGFETGESRFPRAEVSAALAAAPLRCTLRETRDLLRN